MTLSDETVMAYVDGELDATARAEVEAVMRENPQLALRIAKQKALRSTVRLAFENVADEPVPDRLLQAVRSAPVARSNVIPLHRKPQRRWSWPEWTAIAASLVIGVLVSRTYFERGPGTGPVISHDGQMIASGALDHALSEQLAANQPATAPVQIGVSFRARSGDYCRTFVMHDATALAGLACRQQGGWRVRVLSQGEAGAQSTGTLRQASSAVPASVLQAVNEEIAGDPLDASAEAAAKGKKWAR